MSTARRTLAGIVLSLSLVAPSAMAQGGRVAEARTYFNAGAQAYEAGQFPAAIQAFEHAYQLAPRPAITFTIGQAHRRQYYIEKRIDDLRKAIEHYRQYLSTVPEGGRRADAAQALAELEPIAARFEASEDPAADAPSAVAQQTRLMVTSPTEQARVSLDGGPATELPLIAEVSKGKHRVVMRAPGFFDETREVEAVEGGILALDLVLRERPGAFVLRVEDDADVSIDGRLVGVSPLTGPVEVAAGRHIITVMRNGRKGYSREVDVKRGEKLQLDVELESSGQRVASHVLLITGGAAVLAGGAFTFLAVRQENRAKDVRDEVSLDNIGSDRLLDYNDTLDRRDRWRSAAVISFGGAVAAGAAGVLLYSFDRPSLRASPVREPGFAPSPNPAQQPKVNPSPELSASPLWAPGLTGAALQGRF